MLVSPISWSGLVVGLLLAFGVLATVQSLVLLGSGIYFIDGRFDQGIALFFLVELFGSMTAPGLGLVLSLFARNEFQVLQCMPTVIGPAIILGGTFMPVESLPVTSSGRPGSCP